MFICSQQTQTDHPLRHITGNTIMNAKTFSIASLAATVAFVASASIALAQPGVITQDTKVHDYPSNGASVVDWASDGQDVNIKKCKSGWCLVKYDGLAGWVKQNRVAAYDTTPSYPVPHHPHHGQPGVDIGVFGGPGGVSFGFGLSSY
jgi:uncharacterized protein YraI